ncbi:unnamed protein product [Moneuplotes crassus]|uniref:non-specific serine/threonine protein kinase n=1 Tax=Euplotes crassus TaxID=5936 RepID=A0AAD1XCF9_EUPCR|nr:unnamed protein product [Moneuplotes crassus]
MEAFKAPEIQRKKTIVKATHKNVLRKCYLNLQKNFSDNNNDDMPGINLFNSDFNFSLPKSTEIGVNADFTWNKIVKAAIARKAKSIMEPPTTQEMIGKGLISDLDALSDESDDEDCDFRRMESTLTGNVRPEYNEKPEIKRIHSHSWNASGNQFSESPKVQSGWNSPRLCELYPDISINDFEIIKFIGRGSFSVINLANFTKDNQNYALKQCRKEDISRSNKITNLMREKDILSVLDHQNMIRLEETFQDDTNLYFCFQYYQYGDLSALIRSKKKLNLDQTRFYAMELINALEYLRDLNIVHRDIKPENIMIDNNFHCKLGDFGCAKVIDPEAVKEEINQKCGKENDVFEVEQNYESFFDSTDDTDNDFDIPGDFKQATFVGTPLYISPEMLEHSIAHFSSDLWSLGCVIYQCLLGYPPFKGSTERIVFEEILNCQIEIPIDIDAAAEDLILKLLSINPLERLGAGEEGSINDFEVLKSHVFFNGYDFNDINNQNPPIESILHTQLSQEDDYDDLIFSPE